MFPQHISHFKPMPDIFASSVSGSPARGMTRIRPFAHVSEPADPGFMPSGDAALETAEIAMQLVNNSTAALCRA
jgi:hypothetical protein